jgi:hypothetical protein
MIISVFKQRSLQDEESPKGTSQGKDQVLSTRNQSIADDRWNQIEGNLNLRLTVIRSANRSANHDELYPSGDCERLFGMSRATQLVDRAGEGESKDESVRGNRCSRHVPNPRAESEQR